MTQPNSTISNSISSKPIPYQQPAPSNRFRGLIQGKTRIVSAWIFSIVSLLLVNQNPHTTAVGVFGIFLILVGAALRTWASGYLYKDRFPAVSGPYSRTRNPLYLGTFMMGLGCSLFSLHWILPITVGVFFFTLYHFIILDEETKLREIFGPSYNEYLKKVPRFFPLPTRSLDHESRRSINPNTQHHQFSWAIAKQNKALEPIYTGLIFVLAAYLAHHAKHG